MDSTHKLDMIIGFVLANGYPEVKAAALSIREELAEAQLKQAIAIVLKEASVYFDEIEIADIKDTLTELELRASAKKTKDNTIDKDFFGGWCGGGIVLESDQISSIE